MRFYDVEEWIGYQLGKLPWRWIGGALLILPHYNSRHLWQPRKSGGRSALKIIHLNHFLCKLPVSNVVNDCMSPEYNEGKKSDLSTPPSGYSEAQQRDWQAGKAARASEENGKMLGEFLAKNPFALPLILLLLIAGEFFLRYKAEIILTIQCITGIAACCYVAIRWLHIRAISLLLGACTIGLFATAGIWAWWELAGRDESIAQIHEWDRMEAQSLINQARDKRYNDSISILSKARYKHYTDSIALAKQRMYQSQRP